MELKRQQGSVGGEALPFVLKALPRMELGFMLGLKTRLSLSNLVIINANSLAVNRYHLS
jgi:hypothetical protein